MKGMFRWVVLVGLFLGLSSFGATLHVSPSGSHTPPFSNWTTAATSVQSAVNAASNGDMVLVNDGHYLPSSVIIVRKNITIRSVNGADTTIVEGGSGIGPFLGPSGSCFDLGSSACVVDGFTITNGIATGNGSGSSDPLYGRNGGGIRCSDATPQVNNCAFVDNLAWVHGGGMYKGTASNCVFIANSAWDRGGGLCAAPARHCTFSGNSAGGDGGGGLYNGRADYCSFNSNTASGSGGGMSGNIANHCVFTKNRAGSGGGMGGGTAYSCTFTMNHADGGGGGKTGGTASNCTFTSNSAHRGGGGFWIDDAIGCVFNDNHAEEGGGLYLYLGTASNCTFKGNVGSGLDGHGTANSCTFKGNIGSGMVGYGTANSCIFSGNLGRGMAGGTANNCIFTGNLEGGMLEGTANNCVFSGNFATQGGGMYGGIANNCTFSGNVARENGGGMYRAYWVESSVEANNCIFWQNIAGDGNDLYGGVTVNNTCSLDVGHGVNGNITDGPLLVSSSHLATTSPCVGAGNATYVSGADIDGDAWHNPPSMGCDEPGVGADGTIQLSINMIPHQVVIGLEVVGTISVIGDVTQFYVDFGNGNEVTNSLLPVTNIWVDAGVYDVVLTAFNNYYPAGISVTQSVEVAEVLDAIIHVSPLGDDGFDGRSWATAKATIQAGVDAAFEGGIVLVTNGTYSLSSQVEVGGRVIIQSVNGADETIVDGGGAVRCFNLGWRACVVDGFTIANGFAPEDQYGGGVKCLDTTPQVNNCTITGNLAEDGGGMSDGTASNCIFTGNSATGDSYNYGGAGGMWAGIANDCIFTGNTAGDGGGMVYGTASNCTFTGNAARFGGGMKYGMAYYCVFFDNSADRSGGGTYESSVYNCTFTSNSAAYDGGGMYCDPVWKDRAYNCAFIGNSAESGGGMYYGDAYNCTFNGNSALEYGGGLVYGTAKNCIFWQNIAGLGTPDSYDSTLEYSCSPNVVHGTDGNIKDAPLLVSSFRIMPNSPCRGSGSSLHSLGRDIDGQLWLNPPSMGCDEYIEGSVTGSIEVSINKSPIAILGYPLELSGSLLGAVSMCVWDFGDGHFFTNNLSAEHAWSNAGTYDVVLTAYNDSNPFGVAATQTIHVLAATDVAVYVASSGNDANDGSSWESAKATIQAGVNAQNYGGGLVYVSNGTYVITSTIIVDKNIKIQSVNGAGETIVDGCGTNRCFTLVGDNTCSISGFSVINGSALDGNRRGGGIYCLNKDSIVSSCVIRGNTAREGGGMYGGTANNCTLIGNSADWGGGMSRGVANNCIIWHNIASEGGNNLSSSSAQYSCSPDVPHGGGGNITNEPAFVSFSHISPSSPCRGSGSSLYSSGVDVDGQSWLNPPSMGCDEYYTDPLTGSIEVSIDGESFIAITGYPLELYGSVLGAASMNIWDFGDDHFITNNLSAEHAWSNAGSYDVVLTVFNDTYPLGVSATQTIQVLVAADVVVHVASSGNDANDGSSWESAKATIQAGVNAQNYGGGLVYVSNGTYVITSTIIVDKNIKIQSVNGPDLTVVDGGGTNRCFNLGSYECSISGFAVVNGYTTGNGGGVYCQSTIPVISNCIIQSNSASYGGGVQYGTINDCVIIDNSAISHGGGLYKSAVNKCEIRNNKSVNYYGGGGYDCTANSCTVSGNSAGSRGGGMYNGTANSCVIYSNSADSGGGMYYGTANSCMIYSNSADSGGGMYYGSANNCTVSGNTGESNGGGMYKGSAYNCIIWYNDAPSGPDLYNLTARYTCSPDVTHGVYGSITNAPRFVDEGTGDYRLQSSSPCIDAGYNYYVYTTTELDGKPRISDGIVDMGAYEFSYDLSLTPKYGLYYYGYESGAIFPTNQAYTLSNQSNSNLSWTASWSNSWFSVSPSSGMLVAGESTNVTVLPSEMPLSLPAGRYSDLVVFSNQISGVSQLREVYLDLSDRMQAEPWDGFTTTGVVGGPFTPANMVYTLYNLSEGSDLLWVASWSNSWLSVSPSSGTLAAGGAANVVASLGVEANSMLPGTYSDWVAFSNFASGAVLYRNVQLTVNERTLDHFEWAPVASMQYVGQAFPVKISAIDQAGSLLSDYATSADLVGFQPDGMASNVTVGTGTNSWDLPMETYYEDSRTQVIYLQEEIGSSCTITSLALYVSTVPGQTMQDWTIRMRHTSLNEYLSPAIWESSDWITVYQGDELPGATGLREFTFSKLFEYNGTDNLMVDFSHNNSSWSSAGLCDCFSMYPANRSLYYYTDSGHGDPLGWPSNGFNPAGYLSSYIPNINLGTESTDSISITPSNTGSFIGGVWTGAVTVQELATNMFVRAIGMGGGIGTSNPFSVVPALVGDTDSDGVPDWWEIQYFGGVTNAITTAVCSNGVNTVMEAYIAGFDPTDPDVSFNLESVKKVPEGFTVNWNPVTGRVYDVLWTPDLDRGFQLLAAGLGFPINSYTDTLHTAHSSGYYMVAVRLPGMNGDSDGDGMPDEYESQYFSDAVASVAGYDFDKDGQSNIEEYIAGTNPTNSTSFFKASKVWRTPFGTVVEWESVTGRVYSVLWSSAPSVNYKVLESGIDYPQNSYTDTVHSTESSGFYKVDVQMK